MIVKLTSKRQVTFPARVLEALGVGPGDRLDLVEGPEGCLLRPRRVAKERLAPLRDQVERGKKPFDLEAFREAAHDPSLRD